MNVPSYGVGHVASCTLRKRKVLSLAVAMASCLSLDTPVFAQDALVLEEVIVTARKREESLQETPITVSAITGDRLKEAGLTKVSDLTGFVPGLDLQSGNGVTGDANPFIRGIGQRETRVSIDSGVGVYLNGIYVGRNSGALLDFVDIEQVQVLRGPQGTLFGKNTTGGALVVNTVKPSSEFGGRVSATAGNYGRQNASAVINLPLVDNTLYSRFSVGSIKRDGLVENAIDGEEYSDEDRMGVSAQFRWIASDDVIMDVFYSADKTRQRPRAQTCVYALDTADTTPLETAFANFVGPGTIQNACLASNALGPDKFQTNATSSNIDENGFAVDSGVFRAGRYDVDTTTLGITTSWEVGEVMGLDSLEVKNIIGYRNTQAAADEDLDATYLPILERWVPKQNDTDQYSIELQFNGSAMDERLNFTTGVYFFQERTIDDQKWGIAGGPYVGSVPVIGLPIAVLPTATFTEQETDNRSMAWFGQIDFDITEHISFTLGARWTWEERETEITESNVFFRTGPGSGAGAHVPADACTSAFLNSIAEENYTGPSFGSPVPPAASNGANTAAGHFFGGLSPTLTSIEDYTLCNLDKDTGSRKDIAWTPMGSLRFLATDSILDSLNLDDAMVFITYSEGFRSGGIVDGPNDRIFDFPQADPSWYPDQTGVGADDESVGADMDDFEPETVQNIEVGAKIDAFDRRLRANMAAFYTEYDDMQVTNVRLDQATGNPQPFLDNAGGAIISGFELELNAIIGENWRITHSMAYTDADLKEFKTFALVGGSEVPIDRADEPMTNVPRWQAFLAIDYYWNTESWGTITPGFQVRYFSEVNRSFDRGSYDSGFWEAPEEAFVDARILWQLPDDRTTITLWGKNIDGADDDYLVGGVPLVSFSGSGGQVYADPRTYGIDLTYTFGDF